MRRRIAAVLVLASGACVPVIAKAGAIQYGYSYVVASPVGTNGSGPYVPSEVSTGFASNGSTVTLEMIFEEQTFSGQSLITGQGGLYGAGAQLAQSGTLPAVPATISSFTLEPGFNGAFNLQSVNGAGTSGYISETSAAATSGPLGTTTGAIVLVPLGEATFTLHGNKATQFTISNALPDTGGPTLSASSVAVPNGYNFDASNSAPNYNAASPTTFTVVPEPAAVSLLALGGILACVRRRRVRKG